MNISEQVAFANAYHNVLATSNGANPHIHPSEPNYLWAEAGDNFGISSDADPYTGGTNQNTDQISFRCSPKRERLGSPTRKTLI